LTYKAQNDIIILSKGNRRKPERRNMEQMGMTDKQFNGFIRFLIDGLKEAQEEKDADKKNERLQKILDNLQSTLED
jgi:cysteine sulfinate desulfinase/cysteine desulfurase-like protein